MKRLVALFLALCMMFTFAISAYAADDSDDIPADDSGIVTPYSVGLITAYSLSMTKTSAYYSTISGSTICQSSVVKCGMIDIVIQQRLNSSSSWSDYLDLDDETTNSGTYYYSRAIALPAGYQYRVMWKHYAKKSLLSTEKITKYSNYVQY